MNTLVPTKAERLQQLREEDSFHKVLDKIFDRDWRRFCKEVSQKNTLSNQRLFKVLVSIKGKKFVADLIKLMALTKTKGRFISLVRQTSGVLLKDRRFATIPEWWIDQRAFEDGIAGKFYIQVRKDRWIMVHY